MSVIDAQTLMIAMGLAFAGVVGALIVGYRGIIKLLTEANKDLMTKLEGFTLLGMAIYGSEEAGHPMVGPAALQQLAKVKEAQSEKSPVEGKQVEKANVPRAGVTMTQRSGV